MTIWMNRVLLLLVFAIYWGGLTFYTGIVVRISHDVLNDPMDGGLITQRVTAWLQILGAAAVVLMLMNALIVAKRSTLHGGLLIGCSSILGCAVLGLFIVHGQLDAVIDVSNATIIDRDGFTIGHQRYNQLTTVQWIASLVYLVITVFAWHRLDTQLT
ncbi:hypothetical protein [Planctomycetes bacterium K23_9]|uniref:DUF4149 domain-containing protein n=1 Tax=Stieleria marina TaxID=1930275 RepID=A0A517NLZ7_9BACT|nr:hypothetical protein K239x_00890 [Planctomycetes bacterium K23_9]